jgi:hypothetical protein
VLLLSVHKLCHDIRHKYAVRHTNPQRVIEAVVALVNVVNDSHFQLLPIQNSFSLAIERDGSRTRVAKENMITMYQVEAQEQLQLCRMSDQKCCALSSLQNTLTGWRAVESMPAVIAL